MLITNLKDIRLSCLAAAVSNNWTSNDEISNEDPSVIKKFIRKTGVKGRYNAGIKQTAADFCFAAAKKILDHTKIDKDEIGVIIFVTQTPDYRIPATSCVIQGRLGLACDCIAFDVNLGCSGFTYGLNIASSILHMSNAKYGLILCGDTAAKEKSHKQKIKTSHSASMLFGDAGTAILIEKTSNSKPISMISKTDGKSFKAIIDVFGYYRHPDPDINSKLGSTMDDIAVFNFAISEVPDILKKTIELGHYSIHEYDCLVLHQANLFILKQIAKKLDFPIENVLVSLDEFGNTSSASIPISLVKEYGENKENKEIHALMCGFGVGLSWSTVDCYININDILPLIHTDDYFDDGYTSTEE